MFFNQSISKKIVPVALGMLVASSAMAQESTSAAPEQKSNLLAILLVVTAAVLAFVVWGMAQALLAISKQIMAKNRAATKAAAILLVIVFSCMSQLAMAQEAAKETVQSTPNYGGLSATSFYTFVGVIVIEFFAILFLTFSIRRLYIELVPEQAKAKTSAAKWAERWAAIDRKYFTKSVAVEREADILLDHDYDGIRELDNSLPPWWKWGFVATIIFAVSYLGIFHAFGTGKNPTQEYAAEMEQARIEKEMYEANNKDKVDESNVPMADAAGLEAGKNIFETNCAACHLKDGGGNVGPNLTDNYWLHKGSLNDIYASIKKGYPDKGMQAWGGQFTPKQISQIASYIKSLKGSHPATPKAPQGDLFEEAGAATDSTAAASTTKADSTIAIKSTK